MAWASSLRRCPERVSWGLAEWGVDRAPGGYEALHKFAVMQRELFLKLPPMARAPQTLRRLSKEGVRIRIITHRLFIKYFHQVAVLADDPVARPPRHSLLGPLLHAAEDGRRGGFLYRRFAGERRAAAGRGAKTVVSRTHECKLPLRAHSWEEVLPLVMAEKLAWEAKKQVPSRHKLTLGDFPRMVETVAARVRQIVLGCVFPPSRMRNFSRLLFDARYQRP